jgi:hypothetical protein
VVVYGCLSSHIVQLIVVKVTLEKLYIKYKNWRMLVNASAVSFFSFLFAYYSVELIVVFYILPVSFISFFYLPVKFSSVYIYLSSHFHTSINISTEKQEVV